jgi:hypothetical protein
MKFSAQILDPREEEEEEEEIEEIWGSTFPQNVTRSELDQMQMRD